VLARYYFEEAKTLGNHGNLIAAAQEVGVSGVERLLSTDDLLEEVKVAHEQHITGDTKALPAMTFTTPSCDMEVTITDIRSPEDYMAVLARILSN